MYLRFKNFWRFKRIQEVWKDRSVLNFRKVKEMQEIWKVRNALNKIQEIQEIQKVLTVWNIGYGNSGGFGRCPGGLKST